MDIENLMICLMVGHQWEVPYPRDASSGGARFNKPNLEERRCRRCGKTELNSDLYVAN